MRKFPRHGERKPLSNKPKIFTKAAQLTFFNDFFQPSYLLCQKPNYVDMSCFAPRNIEKAEDELKKLQLKMMRYH